MRIGYLDPFSGASGEMLLGALLDLGVPLDAVHQVLDGLHLEGWELGCTIVSRRGIGSTLVEVQAPRADVVRTWAHIRDLLGSAKIPPEVRDRAVATYQRLARAEGQVHRRDPERVVFHEIGPVDGLITIVGACAAFQWLGLDRLFCGPVAQGVGVTRGEHGLVPIPSPVVLELLRGAPTYSTGESVQLSTPTGAALLAEWTDEWSPLPSLRVDLIGYGAGARQLERPNVLRVVVGDEVAAPATVRPLRRQHTPAPRDDPA